MATQTYKNNYIFQIFILNTIIFSLLMGYFWISLYPHVSQIESQKQQLASVVENLQRIKKQGISFDEFISMQGLVPEENSYVKTLFQAIDQKFYDSEIKNTSSSSFDDSVASLSAKVEQEKKSEIFLTREKLLETLIPKYSLENFNIGDELTDFKFVNYVESLLYAFNLTTTDPIGVSEIKPLQNYSTDVTNNTEKKQDSVDSNIFYIPVSLDIKGKKEDIIDFLTFAENIGNISIQDGDIKVYSDTKIQKKLSNSLSQNIYQNQLFDIERFNIKDYIDSSYSQIPGDFLTYIKETQGKEKINVEISFRFYVKGLPNYKIKESIKNTVKKYEELTKTLKEIGVKAEQIDNDSSDSLILKSQVKSRLNELLDMQKEVQAVNSQLNRNQDIDELYRSTLGLDRKLDEILVETTKMETKLQSIKK